MKEALAAFGLDGQEPRLISHRENRVYEVALHGGRRAALRLHRPGYHDFAALASEMLVLEACSDAGLAVPAPLPARNGARVVALEAGGAASLISWIDGVPIGQSGARLGLPKAVARARYAELGAALARLHDALDRWTPPRGFQRPRWDAQGLLGEAPVWGRFWESPILEASERALIEEARKAAMSRLAGIGDTGIVHADPVRENLLVQAGGTVALIDFDDCGTGFRLHDLATALHPNDEEPDAAGLRGALLEGYARHRALPRDVEAGLDLFLMVRAFTLLGWIAARAGQSGMEARGQRMRAIACARATDWMRANT